MDSLEQAINDLSPDELQSYLKSNSIFAPEINPVFEEVFKAFIENKDYRAFHLFGGRGSSKSYVMRKMQEYLFRGYTGYNCRILLLRTTKESAKKSIFQGLIDVVTKDIGQSYKDIEKADMNRGTMEIKSPNLRLGHGELSHQVYVDSFSNDESTKEKLKGYSNITHVFIEELKELPTSEMYDQLLVTMARPFKDPLTGIFVQPQLICAYNTPPADHWLVNKYFDLVPSEYEGFSQLKPKSGVIEGQDGMTFEELGNFFCFSTIYDNLFFKQSIVNNLGERAWKALLFEQYERTKLYDPYSYYTETLGLVGNGRAGKIYKDWTEIPQTDYDSIQSDEELFYGIDFGFSEDVSSVVEVKIKYKQEGETRDKLYLRPVIYERGLLASTLAIKIKTEIPDFGYSKFFADHRPEAIAELELAGMQNIEKATKGKDSRTPQVSFILNYEVYYVEMEVQDNFGKTKKVVKSELDRYHWIENKKTSSFEPSDGNDHILDSIRYSIYSRLRPDNEALQWEQYFDKINKQPFTYI
jgi:phage terminase large subunit